VIVWLLRFPTPRSAEVSLIAQTLNACIPLHVPELMTLLAAGEQLRLFDEALAG
jgi:hypothetical protein